jgi:hypothetical protein
VAAKKKKTDPVISTGTGEPSATEPAPPIHEADSYGQPGTIKEAPDKGPDQVAQVQEVNEVRPSA